MSQLKHLFLISMGLLLFLGCAKKEEELVPTGSPLPTISVQCGDSSCM